MNLVYAEYKEACGMLIKIRIANQATDESVINAVEERTRSEDQRRTRFRLIRSGAKDARIWGKLHGPGKQNEFLR